ncbi:MAG: beta-ketoacyl-ACP synthase II [Anaerolineae bacterium]|nr:beta-ketoacyl-ACP synthase II [Anaerolineae bacterium]
MRRRVVITGLGALTPVGLSAPATWAALVAGQSGIGPVTQFDASPFPSRIAGEVKGFDPAVITTVPPKEVRRLARAVQFTVTATQEALTDANLKWPLEEGERAGVFIGTTLGGFEFYNMGIKDMVLKNATRILPYISIGGLPNIPAFQITQAFGIKGISNTISTACAAGTQSIGEAAEVIRRGTTKIMIAGGVEALVIDLFYAAFSTMHAVSTHNEEPQKASRPFDAKRDGFIIGEGCTMMVLEELEHAKARGAKIYAEILGHGASADAYHIAAPDPEATGAVRAMAAALADAGLAPEDIDYINAHGTSTPLNDATETLAIKKLFGEHAYSIPVSSTKSMLGHAFGGAGAIEALACTYTLRDGIIHPTINYETPDPACDLDYVPNVARKAEVNVTLSNSFGLGGQNAALILGKYTE